MTYHSTLQSAQALVGLMERVRKEHQLLPYTPSPKQDVVSIKDTLLIDTSSDTPPYLNRIYDRQAFLTRLKTFSVLYIQSHRPVSAMTCAKHGWHSTRTVDTDSGIMCLLACSDCTGTMAVVDLSLHNPKDPRVQTIKAKYEAGLYTLHTQECFWRLSRCDDSINRFPISSFKQARVYLQHQSKRLCESQHPLPALVHPLTRDRVEALQEVCRHESPSSSMDSYLLPLFGWCLEEVVSAGVSSHSIICNDCFHRHFLDAMEGELSFDLVQSHRTHCPWIHGQEALIQWHATESNSLYSLYNTKTPLSGYQWMILFITKEHRLLLQSLVSDRTIIEYARQQKALLHKRLEGEAKEILRSARSVETDTC
ncbi:C3HC zinc finger-like-domain-containing protein [Spinellus fusiger]|nr:C3HC zinc finger-like-domain-containing protein [Spinellus fusiger]